MKLLLEQNPLYVPIRKRTDIEMSKIKIELTEAISEHVIMLKKLNWTLDGILLSQYGNLTNKSNEK